MLAHEGDNAPQFELEQVQHGTFVPSKRVAKQTNFLVQSKRSKNSSSDATISVFVESCDQKDFEMGEEVQGSIEPKLAHKKKFSGRVLTWNPLTRELEMEYNRKECRLSIPEEIKGVSSKATWKTTRTVQHDREKMKNDLSASIHTLMGFCFFDVETDLTNCTQISPTQNHAQSLENAIYLHAEDIMLRKLSVHEIPAHGTTRGRPIRERLQCCPTHIVNAVMDNLQKYREKHNLNLSFGLDKESLNMYLSACRKVISSFELLSLQMDTFPCNVPPPTTEYSFDDFFDPAPTSANRSGYHYRVGEMGRGFYKIGPPQPKANAPLLRNLTFVEKTIVTWGYFEQCFKHLVGDGWQDVLRGFLCIPNWRDDLSEEDKTEMRKVAFVNIQQRQMQQKYKAVASMPICDMISICTMCLNHYARENKWKYDFVTSSLRIHIAVGECLAKYWLCRDNFAYQGGNFQELLTRVDQCLLTARALQSVQKLQCTSSFLSSYVGVLFPGYIKRKTLDWKNTRLSGHFLSTIKEFNYNFGQAKKRHIREFFYSLLEDQNVVDKNVYDMMFPVVGDINLEDEEVYSDVMKCPFSETEECGYTCLFIKQSQNRSADEPMTEHWACKKCQRSFTVNP